MAFATATIAAVGLAVGAVGTVASITQQRKAEKEQKKAARLQAANQAEQSAANEREAAIARRQQIREERIKRAQIVQASENTGTADSSAATGSIGGMQTTLGSNLGMNQGMFMQGQRISMNAQGAANAMSSAQTYTNRSGFYSQVGGFGLSLQQEALAQQKAGRQKFGLV